MGFRYMENSKVGAEEGVIRNVLYGYVRSICVCMYVCSEQ
jgi:hypothetical protein